MAKLPQASSEFSIRFADPESLKPYEKNPRVISQAAIDKVLASVREFGWRQPIVVDEDGVILVGHTRRLAAIKGGYKLVPVHDAIGLSEAQKKAYRLADNRTGEESQWDMPMLSAEIAGLRLEGFDLAPLGFDLTELRGLEAQEPGKDPEAIPEPPAKPVTKPGDLWELGDHYLLCGDSTKAEDVEKVLDGATPNLMVTDPPYGVNYDPEWRHRAGVNKSKRIGKVSNDGIADWSKTWELFPGRIAYVWHGALHSGTVAESLAKNGFSIRSQIIWAKERLVIGRGDYHWQHEPCWYGVRDKGNWTGDRKQTTLWNISSRDQDTETAHGTQKPVECMRRPIENNSLPGGAVYEPFSGSGTTIIAAEMTGRRCYAIEISPAYCDVNVRRWEEFTGKKAKLAENGETFEQTAKRRKVPGLKKATAGAK